MAGGMDRILHTLRESGLPIKPHVMRDCMNSGYGYNRNGGGYDPDEVFKCMLYCDLCEVAAGVLPADVKTKHNIRLKGPIVLQVEEVINISANRENRTSDGPNRMLKLLLTDGLQRVVALEYRSTACLSASMPRGTKLCVSDVLVRRGVLMLDPYNVLLLGGAVPKDNSTVENTTAVSKPDGTAPENISNRATGQPFQQTDSTLAPTVIMSPRHSGPTSFNNPATHPFVSHTSHDAMASRAPVYGSSEVERPRQSEGHKPLNDMAARTPITSSDGLGESHSAVDTSINTFKRAAPVPSPGTMLTALSSTIHTSSNTVSARQSVHTTENEVTALSSAGQPLPRTARMRHSEQYDFGDTNAANLDLSSDAVTTTESANVSDSAQYSCTKNAESKSASHRVRGDWGQDNSSFDYGFDIDHTEASRKPTEENRMRVRDFFSGGLVELSADEPSPFVSPPSSPIVYDISESQSPSSAIPPSSINKTHVSTVVATGEPSVCKDSIHDDDQDSLVPTPPDLSDSDMEL